MTLTKQILHSAGTQGMGFNRAQLSLLGVSYPPKKGWLNALVGAEISDDTWKTVIRLRGIKRKAERNRVIGDKHYIGRLL